MSVCTERGNRLFSTLLRRRRTPSARSGTGDRLFVFRNNPARAVAVQATGVGDQQDSVHSSSLIRKSLIWAGSGNVKQQPEEHSDELD